MRNVTVLFLLILLTLGGFACQGLRPRPQTILATFNRGAALLEQYRYSEAVEAFEEVLRATPEWTAARYNLGLAYLNLQSIPGAIDYLSKAQRAFEQVLDAEPNHPHANFSLGLLAQHLGRDEQAIERFEAVYAIDPNDPYVVFKYAEALLSLDRTQEGTTMLEKVVELDPGFVSGVYRLGMQYQRAGRRDDAAGLFARFKQLKTTELTGGTFTVMKAYGTVGKYYTAIGPDGAPLGPSTARTQTRVVFSPQLKTLDEATQAWQSDGSSIRTPGLAAGDVDNDGDLDLCLTATGPDGATSLWRNDGKGQFGKAADLATHGVCPCFGDVDNDGDLDLWLGRVGSDLYLQNDGEGNFRPAKLKGVAAVAQCTHGARLIDIDSDGDLDLPAFGMKKGVVGALEPGEPAASSVYNNNRNGTFEDIAAKLGLTFADRTVTAPVFDDFDNDRDLDLVLLFADGEPIAWVNDRAWQYHTLDAAATGLVVSGALSATTGDPDKDGDRDLLVFSGKTVELFINQGRFRFERDADFAHRFASLGGSGGQFADIDNDGDLDVFIADARRLNQRPGPVLLLNIWPEDGFVNAAEIDPGNLLTSLQHDAPTGCIVADFTGDGKCDVLLAGAGEKPYLIENATAGGHWIELDLAGTRTQDGKSRSNNSAIGARVDVTTGGVFQQHVVGAASGPVATSPLRVHVGLGPYTTVDWLRITWPDAVLQAELEIPADQVLSITEIQRKVSSCPHLFAWTGEHFEFISDFGGMGGVGYLLGPGQYNTPDPTEYVPVPGLTARNGHYVLQVVEPIEEIVFFDEAKLLAIDHPAQTLVFPSEMMAVTAPPPQFEVFCIRETIEPLGAVDHRGRDVTERLAAVDRRYAGATDLDPRFVGYAKDHFVDLDFGERLADLPPDARLVLFLQGCVEYPYSSTNFAAAQANLRLMAPSIYVRREGAWTELFREVGYPAGVRHTMTLEVTGKILPSDRRIRVESNMEIYWDRIFLATLLTDADVRISEASVTDSDVHFLGYPREYSPDGGLPHLYDYDKVDRAIAWKTMAGQYTRYGPVTELLGEADDCYVIMGPGEELTLRFDADAFADVPAGYRRTFILKTDSYCKDMDLYSAFAETVEPLPFHGMSAYPPGPSEQYPDDESHRQYHKRFNTRTILPPQNARSDSPQAPRAPIDVRSTR